MPGKSELGNGCDGLEVVGRRNQGQLVPSGWCLFGVDRGHESRKFGFENQFVQGVEPNFEAGISRFHAGDSTGKAIAPGSRKVVLSQSWYVPVTS